VVRAGRLTIIGLLCASYAFFCLSTRPAEPISAPDSQVYLSVAPIVPLGYPVFLKVAGTEGALILQPVIFSAALAFIGSETLLTTFSVLLSIGIVAGSMLVPGLATYHASILTESLFMSGLVAFLAAVIRFVRVPSSGSAALAATIAGLLATLRATGYATLPVLMVMVGLERRRLAGRTAAVLLAAALPMLALSAGERVAARVVHGDRLSSLMGRHLFAKAGLIEAEPPVQPSRDPLRARLEEHLSVAYGPVRSFIARAPRDLRGVLTLYYEGCLQGPCVPELGWSTPGSEDRALNDELVQVGVERIARAPLTFAKLTATEYTSLWTAYKQRHPETGPALSALIAANRPLPFEREAFKLAPQDTLEFRPYEPVRFIQPAVTAIGWLTGGLALFGLAALVTKRDLPPSLAIACLSALAAHGGLLLSALFAAGIARFIVSLWPAVMTAVLFAAWSTWNSRSPDSGQASEL
jgi:hypothetical protein